MVIHNSVQRYNNYLKYANKNSKIVHFYAFFIKNNANQALLRLFFNATEYPQ